MVFDGELSLTRELGPLRLMGTARAMSDGYAQDRTRYALAGGGTLRFGRWLALAGDYGKLLDASGTEEGAWGVGVQIGIPYTPHTLSLQSTNTNTATIQGSSKGTNQRRWGFEFTVPITLARYFGDRPQVTDQEAEPVPVPVDTTPVVTAPTVPPAVVRDTTVRDTVVLPVRDTVMIPARDTVRMPVRDTARTQPPAARPTQPPPTRRPPAENRPPAATTTAPRSFNTRMRQLQFQPSRLQIPAGSAVVWRNDDQVAHTVKAADGSWESALIQPGGSYRRTFSRAGTYSITCGPHPFMKQTVEVR
jgi:plastocyanin